MTKEEARDKIREIGQVVELGKIEGNFFVKTTAQSENENEVNEWVEAIQIAINAFQEQDC